MTVRDDAELRDRIRRLANVPTPSPKLAVVSRRSRTLHVRRMAVVALVAAAAGAAIAIPLRSLGGIGGGGRDVGSIGVRVRPIGFEVAEGWAMAAVDPADSPGEQTVFVTNGPFARADLEGSHEEEGIVVLPTGAEHTRRSLPDDGVLIAASAVFRSRNPLPPHADFPAQTLPLRLPSGSPETAWEGYSEGLSRYTMGGTVNGRFIVVNVYFGSEAPSESVIARAQEELDRLHVDPATSPVDEIDEFGLAIELPAGWDGRLYAWASSPPILELSTLPIGQHMPGDPMMPNRALLTSSEDVSVLLAESDILDPGYAPLSTPISIDDEDRCDGCEILDDGSTPPSGHALFRRAFETGGRSFDLYVEFSSDPAQADLARVNHLLSRLVIDGLTPGNGEDPPILAIPTSWFQAADPLPALVDPVIVVAAGSWDFPRQPLIACGDQPALRDLPADGAFLWIVRYEVEPGDPLGGFRRAVPWPGRFSLDLPSRPSDRECAAGTEGPVRDYLFDAGGDVYLQVHVALGPEAAATRADEVERVLSSYRP
jgi:hypothetical protein